MRTKLLIAGAALAAAASISACSSNSTDTSASSAMMSSSAMAAPMSASTSMPAMAMSKMTGTFSGLNGKMVAGSAMIDGMTVTLTGYSSDQGPDLHLYLANGTTEQAVRAGVQISPVAYDKTMQTFTLPAGVDAGKYTDLVVHCDKALAVFGAAKLSK
ncbi:DM13 domain-containing protein [Gordonia sp. TBRC 11910]|uniref:DM13 domain-containing protein n=1 Tax=Gordonia asplenii TaxID=2725283 RepID=A0A848KUM8_9ACTN|nr:DM13 domain-containing protein [Gordonia asplenii]NMO00193.1 DM13 domain-containing protein [Gordonia asplenii]